MKYRREIDGLRAIAILPVVLFHAGFTALGGGFVGVDVFFVISGYLITSILVADMEGGKFSILTFYERRVRRILPALFVMMAICVPFAWVLMLPEQLAQFGRSVVAVPFFVSNILFWRESNYFAPAAEEKPLLHTWSLAVEEQYYLIFPIVLFWLWRYGRQKTATAIIVMSVASLAIAQWGSRNEPVANFYLAPTRMWELFAGSLCALYGTENRQGNNLLSALGLGAILFSMLAFDAATPFPSAYALVPVVGTVFIVIWGSGQTYVARLLGLPVFVGIGLISYSSYLWHQPLFAFARILMDAEPSSKTMMGLGLVSFMIGAASWRWVEQPFRLKAKGTGRGILTGRGALFGTSAVVGLMLIAVGSVLSYSQGWPSRMPASYFDNVAQLEAANKARGNGIRSGRCQYNGLGLNSNVGDFIAAWDCVPAAPVPGLGIVGIYGDSHSADKAMALRLNGFDVLQVGGAACPLLPGPGYCGKLLDTFHAKAHENNTRTVLIANAWNSAELSPASLEKIVSYWGGRYEHVVVFTPTPVFPGLKNQLIRAGVPGAANVVQHTRESLLFAKAWRSIKIPANVSLIDTARALCAGRDPCSAIAGGQSLLVDDMHLSVAGATLAGAGFVAALMHPDG
ncbi:MAG: acyltransferase family protein [Paracoccaceae bacterium]